MVREEVLLEVLHVHFHLEVRGGDCCSRRSLRKELLWQWGGEVNV
jgi:hypothetical protein